MPNRGSDAIVTALGLTRPLGRLYERLLRASGQTLDQLAPSFDLSVPALTERLKPLVEHELVTLEEGRVTVVPPADAVSRIIIERAAAAAIAHERLEEIAAALPYLAGSGHRLPDLELRGVAPLDGEITVGADGPALTQAIIAQSDGDLMWLRPDQWMLPWEDEMSAAVAAAIAEGRSVRTIYPVRVLTEAPAVIRHRAAIGEEIRLLPDLPTRMAIVAGTHLLLPEPIGYTQSPRAVVRQRGLVELATLYFELLWAQASPLEQPAADQGELRRFLLEQLAAGAQDEQIARRLGLSLRTVRRRVAELMSELDAHSRFQAGAEAARRGWL